MTALATELQNKVLTGQAPSISCKVWHVSGFTLLGFLQEDINFSMTNEYSTEMMSALGDLGNKISNTFGAIQGAVNAVSTNSNGGSKLFNPLSARQLWNSGGMPSFSATIQLVTLSQDSDIISKAQKAIELTTPTYGGAQSGEAMIKAPGDYSFPMTGAFSTSSHAEGTWSIQLGNHFMVDYLVCTSLDVTVSKEVVKTGNSTQPLYINLKFTFLPDRIRFSNETPYFLKQGGSVVNTVQQSSQGVARKVVSTLQDIWERGIG